MSEGRGLAPPHPPVVTGIGALTPVGLDAPSTWRALLEGRSGVGPITSFDASELPTRIAGEIRGFDPRELLGAKRAHRTARFSQLAVAAAREAVADAGLSMGQSAGLGSGVGLGATSGRGGSGEVDAAGVGVSIGSAVAGVPESEGNVLALAGSGPRAVSPYYIASTIPNMAACEVAIDLGAHGPVTASSLACATGAYALLEARRLILAGEAEVVIAGGVDAGICAAMIASLSNMGPLSERNEEPELASRPFDAERDGFVFGEGAVVMVVESSEHARRRGARAYGAIAGGALTSDAFHMSAPEPSASYAAAAISGALASAGLEASQLDYICAHGTGTIANDRAETSAIRQALGARADAVPASSPKSMVGHLIGAAGALSAMACLLAMRDSEIPPTINLHNPDPACDLDYVPGVARRHEVGAALANAFGFGGQNCVLALTRA